MHSHNHSFSYDSAEYEEVPCDLCGSKNKEVLGFSKESRARAVICRVCGLIFVSPRMTRQWYDKFYQEEYRQLGGGEEESLSVRFARQRKHGFALAEELKVHFPTKGLLVDIGSSTGGTLAGIKEVFKDLDVLGIEPSEAEASHARSQGVPTHATLIEDIEKKGIRIPEADCVLSTQALNHFLSPRFFLKWAWQHLKPGGRIVLEVKNFRQQSRRSSRVENSIQIDHVYMFTPETLKEYVMAAGFKPLIFIDDELLSIPEIRRRQQRGLPGFQMKVVAEKTRNPPFLDVESNIDPFAYKKIKSSLSLWRLRANYFFRYGRWDELIPYRVKKFLGK